MADKKCNTGLTEAEVRQAFRRALNDLTDAQINYMIQTEQAARSAADTALGTEIASVRADLAANYVSESDFAALEARVAALEGGGGDA